ncbi:MAG: hypothetical protein COT89_00320 [Candidatus Colwellbacteria bacterium CG10_big_fil_rev_8_21_14_0_10_42_22]|uniref:GGDEF domain-containing protein n=1 Tax=Candidatus Colwellbacteria bacterium CG10_big_fil_rev_8_21_14_0_10_42_22 TaxID=1974540 RepID=A0A2H0VGD8_9BACT|nr:MAG: hypothetical protein COT89_00320 [Candidatus Colwellbacteria bacterium CG10_big_fil_rev_8_21_14_0_10_42_22]
MSIESPKEIQQLRATVLELGQIAEELKKRLEEESRLARQDPETGLLNKRGLKEKLNRRGTETKEKTAVVFLDIDDFKGINDTYGHGVGDRVLRVLGKILKEVAREGDTLVELPEGLAARVGGDEMVLVLPGADEEGAMRVLERINQRVAEEEIETDEGPIKFAISGGVGRDFDVADRKMYEEKRGKKEGKER